MEDCMAVGCMVPRHETALLKRLKGSARRWDRLYGNRKHLLNFNVCVAVCLHVMAAQKMWKSEMK